jgi:hypothetical protein
VRVVFTLCSRADTSRKQEGRDYEYSCKQFTISLSDFFHFDTWYDDVLFFAVDMFDLFLKNQTSHIQITFRGKIIFCKKKRLKKYVKDF